MRTLSHTRLFRVAVFLMCIVAGAAAAGAIKVWSSGETLTSAQLNANFQHIHSLMVGGHGARLVDADVAANANIASTKLAANHFIARAWATVLTKCTGTPCTIAASQGITSVTRVGTGSYRINVATVLTDLNFSITMSATDGASAVARICYYVSAGSTTSALVFVCDSDFIGTRADSAFSFIINDDN